MSLWWWNRFVIIRFVICGVIIGGLVIFIFGVDFGWFWCIDIYFVSIINWLSKVII